MNPKPILTAALALLLAVALLPTPAAADPKAVPPGLAKKPGQMPPGQFKKRYAVGQPLPWGYVRIEDLRGWRLPPLRPGDGYYVRLDDDVYRVARDTAVVLEAMGIVADLFN